MACADNLITKGSDLFFEVTFTDEKGLDIDVPKYDFKLEYFVFSDKISEAGRIDGVLKNCSVEGKKLIVAIDKPVLGSGKLHRRATYLIPDNRFPDGFRTLVEEGIVAIVS